MHDLKALDPHESGFLDIIVFYAGTTEISVPLAPAQKPARPGQYFHPCSGRYNARSTKCAAKPLVICGLKPQCLLYCVSLTIATGAPSCIKRSHWKSAAHTCF